MLIHYVSIFYLNNHAHLKTIFMKILKFHCGISHHQLKSPFLILVAVMVVCHQSCLFRLSVPVDFPRIIFKTCCCTSLGLFIFCLPKMCIYHSVSRYLKITNISIRKTIVRLFWTGYFEFQIIKRTRTVLKRKGWWPSILMHTTVYKTRIIPTYNYIIVP